MTDITITNEALNELNARIVDLLTWSGNEAIPTAVVFGMIDNIKFEHQYATLMGAYQAAKTAAEAANPKIALV